MVRMIRTELNNTAGIEKNVVLRRKRPSSPIALWQRVGGAIRVLLLRTIRDARIRAPLLLLSPDTGPACYSIL